MFCGFYPKPRIGILHGVYPEWAIEMLPEFILRSFTEFILRPKRDASLRSA
jgi:hypothetical protein